MTSNFCGTNWIDDILSWHEDDNGARAAERMLERAKALLYQRNPNYRRGDLSMDEIFFELRADPEFVRGVMALAAIVSQHYPDHAVRQSVRQIESLWVDARYDLLQLPDAVQRDRRARQVDKIIAVAMLDAIMLLDYQGWFDLMCEEYAAEEERRMFGGRTPTDWEVYGVKQSDFIRSGRW